MVPPGEPGIPELRPQRPTAESIERWSDAALCVGSIGKYRGHGHLDEYADAQRALAVTPYTCRCAPAAACPSSRRRSSWSRSRSRTPEEILEESYMLGTRQYS